MESVSTMGSGDLGREVDLEALIDELDSRIELAEINFSSPSMTTIRISNGGPAITLYRSGGFQIRGTPDDTSLIETKDQFLDLLASVGLEVSNPSFEHKNTVHLGDLNQEVNLEALTISLGLENVEYEPEQFPGVIYRPPEFGTVLLVFATGKTIISGTTSEDTARNSFALLTERINQLG